MKKNRILIDIRNGYSESLFQSQKIYFKHLGINESSLIEEFEEETKNNLSKKKNLISFEEKLASSEDWTQEDESEIQRLESEKSNSLFQLNSLFIKTQIDSIYKRIEQIDEKLKKINLKKQIIKYGTLEYYVNKRVNEFAWFLISFKDKNLSYRFFSESEYEDLEDKEISLLAQCFDSTIGKINDKIIKKIAVSSFFRNVFYLDSSPQSLFGKNTLDLTFFQIELLIHAKNFKYIFENSNDIPESISSDPEKIEKWFRANQNAKNVKNFDPNKAIGLSKQDREFLGVNTSSQGALERLRNNVKSKGIQDLRQNPSLYK